MLSMHTEIKKLRAMQEKASAIPFRRQQLQGLRHFMWACENHLITALQKDLGKPRLEALMTDILLITREINAALSQLSQWTRPKKVSTSWAIQPASAYTIAEPLGTVLIIGPWNYPIQLTMLPLIGAIAAGNCVVLKPSEMAPHVSALLAEYLPRYLNTDTVNIIEGGIPETTALLEERFDHIFFTGSTAVGKIIANAAAKYLTPTTLELGGKSPCVVDASANLEVAAERIIWGKFCNAGQTCIAPDYILVQENIAEKLLTALKRKLKEFYGSNPAESKDYGRIINSQHVARLEKFLADNGEIVVGGTVDRENRYIAPTILTNVTEDMPIMATDAEIFGPILPILPIKDLTQAVDMINARPKPLTIYLFSEDNASRNYFLRKTSSGSLVLNCTLLQGGEGLLPFGGVGDSGMGAYHHKATFDIFSHQKSVLDKTTHWRLFDLPSYVNPPSSDWKEWLLRKVI